MNNTLEENTNPWDINSIYDLALFCCPECDFTSQNKQDLVSHATIDHPWVSLHAFLAVGSIVAALETSFVNFSLHHWNVSKILAVPQYQKLLC